jgi:hypothetical protein
MFMDAAEERLRADIVRRAVILLRRGAVCSRTDLFNGAPAGTRDFQRKIINKLIASKAVKKVDGAVQCFQALDINMLSGIVKNDESLALFIWPQPTLELVPSKVVDPEPPVQEVPKEIVQQQVPFQPTVVAAAEGSDPLLATFMETNKILNELIELSGAAFQSIIYMRDKIDSIEKKVNDMSTILEALR